MDGDGLAKPNDAPLLDTVLDEQRERWNTTDHQPVENYLARYPALLDNTEAVIDLIYQEFLLRRRSGESPEAAEYVRRFPEWSEAIIRQFAVDDAMRTADDRTVSLGGPAAPGPEVLDPGKLSPLAAIDGYEILGVLGRGGMGVVYKARDLKLGRIVAIKTISEAQQPTPQQLGRFMAEAEVVARLQHPHIIQIHAIGEQDGRPYFSLEYAEGGSLARGLAEGPMAAGPAARLLETLALAVHAAHKGGVVHRDLKPSNVLLTAENVPKVADFGLAKLEGGDSVRTLSGDALGTPSYMAPEQAEGHSKDVGPAADVYALGAILYHTLTGRPPFLGDSAIETLKLVVSTEVVPPRRQRPGVPRDLETICLKCLEKDPRRRYASAESLAADLKRFNEGRPITARPVGPVGRLGRWGRRNPMLALTSSALALTFALATPSLLLLWLRARSDRAMAEVARDHAERSRDRALGAVGMLLTTGRDALNEEVRPYRRALVAAGLNESQALVRELEGDPRAEFQRAEAYNALAGIQYEGGEHSKALESVRKSIALAESLVARDPASIRYGYVLADALHRLASLWPDDTEYLAAASRSIDICRGLCAQHPEGDRRQWTLLIGMNEFNIGNLHYNRGRLPQATQSLLGARTAFQSVVDLGDQSRQTLESLASTQTFLCRLYSNREQLDDSMASGRAAIELYRTLFASHPEDIDLGFKLNRAHQEIGVLCMGYEKWDQAIQSFESARNTLLELAARQVPLVSTRATIQVRLAMVDQNLCDAYESDPARYAPARRAVSREAHTICEKLGLIIPLSSQPRVDPAQGTAAPPGGVLAGGTVWNLRVILAHQCYETVEYQDGEGTPPDLDLLLESERIMADIHEASPANRDAQALLVIVRRKLAELMDARGRSDDAIRWRSQSLTTARGHADLFYDIAVHYAKRSEAVGLLATKLNSDQLHARRRRFMADAVAMIREAVADGLHDAGQLGADPAFAAIRSDPEFRAILSGLEWPKDVFARPPGDRTTTRLLH